MIGKKDLMGRRILMSVLGVLICGFGVGFTKYAAFGVDPFQSFMGGLAAAVPISFGLLYIIANTILLLFSVIFDRSKIGIATLINLTLLGYVVDFSHHLLLALLPEPTMIGRIVMLIIGIGILSISCSLYFTADLGVSTYDAVALVMSEKWTKIPFRFYRITTDLICVGLGVTLFLISGKPHSELGLVVGVGTILTAFCMGPLIELCNVRLSAPLLHWGTKQ